MPRPRGLPKTGGRKAGTPNKITLAFRERIERESNPAEFLARVMRGECVDGVAPTLEQRIKVALRLLDKVLPTPKALEVSSAAPREAKAPRSQPRRIESALSRLRKGMDREAAPESGWDYLGADTGADNVELLAIEPDDLCPELP